MTEEVRRHRAAQARMVSLARQLDSVGQSLPEEIRDAPDGADALEAAAELRAMLQESSCDVATRQGLERQRRIVAVLEQVTS